MATESRVQPVLATSFKTNRLDTGAIHDELNRLWSQLGNPGDSAEDPGTTAAEPHFGGGGLMRANTLNLLAVARNERESTLVAETVARLHDFLPSRTII